MEVDAFNNIKFPILAFSWIIQSPLLFAKKVDKSVLYYHGTGIPREIRIYFNIENIKVKNKKPVNLKFKNKVYNGYIECDKMDRTRLIWFSDFSYAINAELEKWSLYFLNNKDCQEICPEMQFIKEDYNTYNIRFIDYATNWINGQPITLKEKEIELLNIEDFFNKKIGKKIDYIEQSKRNSLLGFLGEQYILEYEKSSLIKANKISLAERVEHVSDTRGDGYGFDILSFRSDGNPKFIEVKTSSTHISEFYITSNELNCSKDYSGYYYLYRLNNFDYMNKQGNIHITQGNLYKLLNLKPEIYKGKVLQNNK